MKNFILIGILIGWIGILSFWFYLFVYDSQRKFESQIKMVLEYAYSEGQKDVLTGKNITVAYDSVNKTWYWIGSPWDSGSKPIFNLNDNVHVQFDSDINDHITN